MYGIVRVVRRRLRKLAVHELKTWPEHFADVIDDNKSVELRKNDRDFKIGDWLRLREWDPSTERYTGNTFLVDVTHVLSGGPWLADGDVALSIKPSTREGEKR